MGHWSQRQLRGGGGVNPFTTQPPTDAEWSIAQAGAGPFFGFATITNPASAPTDEWQMRWRLNGGAWTMEGPQPVASDLDTAPTNPGDLVEAQAQWFDSVSGLPVAGWSTTQSYIAI